MSLEELILEFLVNNDALSEGLRSRMLGWRHSGFSAHNEVRVLAEDAEGRKKLAGYMLRAAMPLEKMTYVAATLMFSHITAPTAGVPPVLPFGG